MGVYIRFFSSSAEPVPLSHLRKHLHELGGRLAMTLVETGTEPTSGVLTADGEGLAHVEATVGGVALEERAELLESLGRAWSPRARRVRATLEGTRQIVAAQMLHHGRTDEGWGLLAPAVNWLIEATGPLWQADDAGYYEGSTLILRQR